MGAWLGLWVAASGSQWPGAHYPVQLPRLINSADRDKPVACKGLGLESGAYQAWVASTSLAPPDGPTPEPTSAY